MVRKKKGSGTLFGGSLKMDSSPLFSPEKKEVGRDTRRAFTSTQKKQILFQQDSKCARCHKKLDPRAIQFDHEKPWASGGRTKTENGRALCSECHDIVSHEHRLKQVDQKRTTKKEPYSLF